MLITISWARRKWRLIIIFLKNKKEQRAQSQIWLEQSTAYWSGLVSPSLLATLEASARRSASSSQGEHNGSGSLSHSVRTRKGHWKSCFLWFFFFFFAYSPYWEMRLDSMSKVTYLSGIESKTSIQVAWVLIHCLLAVPYCFWERTDTVETWIVTTALEKNLNAVNI